MAILFARPYWTRVWIQQEITEQSKVTVHFGKMSFPFVHLYNLYDVIQTYNNTLGSSYQGLENKVVEWARYIGLHHRSVRLTDDFKVNFALLRDGRLMRATNPRDKICGVAGLSPVLRHCRVDYSLPIHRVYQRVQRYVLQSVQYS